MPRSTKQPPGRPRTNQRSDDPGKQEHFTKIPDSVGEAAWMNGSLLYVYYAIAKHRNFATPDEPVFPSQARIAKITKLTQRQVRRLLKVLEQHGVFKRTPGRGKGHSTRYRFQEKGSWVTTFAGEEAKPKGVMDVRSKGVMDVRSKGVMDVPLSRAIEREPLKETYSTKKSGKCSHPDTACCPHCLTVVSRPSNPTF